MRVAGHEVLAPDAAGVDVERPSRPEPTDPDTAAAARTARGFRSVGTR